MKRSLCWLAGLIVASPGMAADFPLVDLNLEDLVKTDVTSVSRKSQSLADVPAAAFVISADDIRRSGARNLPEVLRLAPGIHVAQINNGGYAVSARGFNSRFADKLQILLDGRSIYNPFFAGVLWEQDPVALDDIERIEVIRGAGAVMWGANAVNGVINIITRDARKQTGTAVTSSIGTQGQASLYVRQGAEIDAGTHWKLSAQTRHQDSSKRYELNEKDADRLDNAIAHFRFDRDLESGNDLSLWASAAYSDSSDLRYNFNPIAPGTTINTLYRIHNESLVGRYRWLSSGGIESSLQTSLARSGLELKGFIDESRTTFDLDYQGRYPTGAHDILWGFGHRTTSDSISTFSANYAIRNPDYTLRSTSFYLNDDWTLVDERLKLGLGMRWETDSRSGNTLSPHASLLWTPSRTDSLWLKFAQAPHLVSRAYQDSTALVGGRAVPLPSGSPFPNLTVLSLNQPSPDNLPPEKASGIEIGYRKQLSSAINLDLTAYRYRYNRILSQTVSALYGCSNALAFIGWLPIDPARCPTSLNGLPVAIMELEKNSAVNGWSNGLEVAAEWLPAPNWRLQLSYTWTHLDMNGGSQFVDQGTALALEKGTPRHTGSLRSQWNIDNRNQFDLTVRGVSGFDLIDTNDTTPSSSTSPSFMHVPGYVTLDLRYALHLSQTLEISLTGRNLTGNKRFEYLANYIPSARASIDSLWMLGLRWQY